MYRPTLCSRWQFVMAVDPSASRNAQFANAYDLAVSWMNRGHALMQQAGEKDLRDAIASYAQAIAVFRQLPVGENPRWANSFGAALMNHGQLLHRVHGHAHATESLASFDRAVSVLAPICTSESDRSNPWPRRILAGTLLNRSNLLLDLGQFSRAMPDAQKAVALSARDERTEPVDAELSLKARRALCDSLGQLLVTPGADQASLASEASDLVDDALEVIRHWSAQGQTDLQPLASRFFRFGAQLYRQHQPHFLGEFIAENISVAGPEGKTIALEAIDAVLAASVADKKFLIVGDPVSERRRQIWRELTALREELSK